MLFVVSLILTSTTSLCGASRVIELVCSHLPLSVLLHPCSWWTGRLWLLRLGYYKLTRVKEQADDWVWLVDHSIQGGTEKCLLILGIRLAHVPTNGRALRHADMEPIDLRPVKKSTGDIVWQQLEEAVSITGVPREILSDHGPDIYAGIRRFCEEHPHTSAIYDVTHKAATILKHVLEQDESWQRFCQLASRTKQQVQQTELAPAAPPAQKTKARYMNVDRLSRWGRKLLQALEMDVPLPAQQVTEKLDWVWEFQDVLEEWTEFFHLVSVTEHCIRQDGFHAGSVDDLKHQFQGKATTLRAQQVRDQLLTFIREESAKARPGEHLVGSSEVIESVFGKVKQIEGPQAKGGFTGLVLSAAALVGPTTLDVMRQAVETVSTTMVRDWCQETIGPSVQSQRKALFAHASPGGTKTGST